ncbi:SinI family autotransporter-associated protein [Budvicia aquatica]|uniref:Ornithine carbamoyltransferase n=1 Tax=Budvicia aquatica TaxID=82979 RepID=A0A2C6DHX1_9GAMM|nr:SinI family autotransporter-associated protein [Budvicia aquatica]PHI28797.1 ornithine carbamoyltransferase [Budvicia aquatica]
MKKNNTFTLKKLVLALALAGYTMSSAYAVMTSPTGTIQGAAPVLSALSNSAVNAVDFSHVAQTAGVMTSGDTITMTYSYGDTDGDADDSTAHVTWYYTKGGVDTAIVGGIVNTPAATIGGTGTSVLTVPAAAIGATAIRVEVQEYSASGDPISGTTINIADVSNGGGGTGPNPPVGPVVPGSNVTPGIYLSTDVAFANNLIGSATNLAVGQTYVFKLWDSAAVGTTDLTATVPGYTWHLVGTSATDNITGDFTTSVSGSNFTIPVNSAADGTPLTGSADGAQGFSLAVDY